MYWRHLAYTVALAFVCAGASLSGPLLFAQGGGNHEPDDGKGTGGPGSPVHIVGGYCNVCGDGGGGGGIGSGDPVGGPGYGGPR